MKKYTILTKTMAVISCTALLYATFPQQVRAQCAADDGITPAVALVTCTCSLGACSDWVTPFSGYHTCSTSYSSGVNSCANDTPYEYYDYGPCDASISFWGMAGCVAALIIAGVGSFAVCFTLGVFTGGTACWAAIAAAATGSIAVCNYCAVHNCAPSATAVNRVIVTPSHPDSNSGSCPG